MDWACSTNGEKRNTWVGEPEGKETTRKGRRRWVDNIKIDLGGSSGLVWLRTRTGGELL
jgi:hypothetical protein